MTLTRPPARFLGAALAALLLAGCAGMNKQEQVPSKDTFECTLDGDRYVVRFADGEARLLLPSAERVVLYQIPTGSGVRFSNGLIELRGRGTLPDGELSIVRDGLSRRLTDCKPVMVPKEG